MPILNHERVARGPVKSWLYMLHGVFGAGRNWGTIARRLTAVRPDWGVVLVDLREHGASRGFSPPHTVATAAGDIAELAAAIGSPPWAVLGHSFGGKVALQYAASAPVEPAQIWVIDSTPEAGMPAGSAWRMLGVVRGLPGPFADRESVVAAIESEGFTRPVAQWMATNLEAVESGYDWRFNIDAMDSLIRDFFATDLWPVVETVNRGAELRFVKAMDSSVISDETVLRIRAAGPSGVRLDELGGGHWLNADNPDGVVELLTSGLPPA